ncbi:MAG TPA: beta galactosidase jelly roll domain-containing protein [Bacteroidota bacterium]|nr:beta galactosidase jelly roll domain-containing protein [Bacteroidota bacterium]
MKSRMVIVPMLLSIFLASAAMAEEWKSVLDLRGKWKFELGDDAKRASVSYNDSKWDEIFVPSPWEDEGYPGYDGYAWYRKHFRLPQGAEKKELYLRLGCVDDVSEIFLNGEQIGSMGCFPPDFLTAYNVEIVIAVPRNLLNVAGDNVIAVRVYDDQLAGGIVQGKIGLYESSERISPEISLLGRWQFKTGDVPQWAGASFDDRSWKKIFVPAYWESQGYPHYDGMAWYRYHFQVPSWCAEKTLVLLLGKIDDLDETYINGVQVGRTGKMLSDPLRSRHENEYSEFRAYTIPAGVLKPGSENIIAVRVFDGGGWGGIYEGPIGITTRERYKEWKKNHSWMEKSRDEGKNIFDWIFGD